MKYEDVIINGKREKIVVKMDDSYNPDIEDLENTLDLSYLENTIVIKDDKNE